MDWPRLRSLAALAALVVTCCTCARSLAADRVALVIGNGNYQHLQKLTACPHDAAKMAATFQKIGIRVHGGKPLIDLTASQMDRALAEFARSLGKDSEAFVYYSGHGAQLSGINYLLPVGFDAEFENEARRQAVSLDSILEILEKTDSKLRVVILDACRDPGNLLPGEPKLKSTLRKGLNEQRVEAPETLVCFATKHGQPSLADDKASYYTEVLADEISQPAELGAIMRKVANRVYQATEKRQLPFTYGSLLQEHFLAGTVPAVAVIPSPAVPAPPVEIARLTTPAPRVPGGSAGRGTPATATKDAPFVNSLGMEFVPVPGTNLLFCRCETRVKDYREYAKSTTGVNEGWMTPESYRQKPFAQGEDHPVTKVSWHDAQAFCAWLSKKEGHTYRLPTDPEWSLAVGLKNEIGDTPREKQRKALEYPWGTEWPPAKGAGNFADESRSSVDEPGGIIKGYDDGYPHTSPVGSFAPNRDGLHDLSGNVKEWCEDWYDGQRRSRVLRGGCWTEFVDFSLRSSERTPSEPDYRGMNIGFRCVLQLPGAPVLRPAGNLLESVVVVLRSGEKLSGKLLRETATEVVLEIRVTATIADERIVPRQEIDKVEKASAK